MEAKYTQDQINRLNQLYQSGLTKRECCKGLGVPTGSFTYLMKKFGFDTRPSGFQIGNKTRSQFQLGEQVEVTCVQCQKKELVPKWQAATRKYCSRSCRSRFTMKNDKHWNWQGGISNRWDKLHNSREYKEWRVKVWQRDYFTCCHCGAKQSRPNPLHAHHIKPKSTHPDLILDVNNGMTLCRKCHDIVHYGRMMHKGRHG